ncbi:MAG: hypothetical protein LBF38_08860 [Deltaproteobacteria bacterium]|jgi:hypothetical protein|nr:hypothetical protein [Deltaproteobacteria bacterium]
MGKRSAHPTDGPCFGQRELYQLDAAVHLAADLVSEEFQLDFGDFRQWPVDVRHYPQLSEEEKRTDVLAQLFRYVKQNSLPRGGGRDFWRVCLYDPVILATKDRENFTLKPLLLYVITHEFIHISRFVRFMELFTPDLKSRQREEDIVHELTEKLLFKQPIENLSPVLEYFKACRYALDGAVTNLETRSD